MTLLTLFKFIPMTNKRKSALLAFLEHQLAYRGKKYIGTKSLETIKVFIDTLIDDCCLVSLPPKSNNFVTTVYRFLKEMHTKKFIPQLKIVQTLVDNTIACCE